MSASSSTTSKLSSAASHEQSGAEQIATLMEQVKAKDVLVNQLTERLEAAAEQLDRIQRTGADRRHPGSGGGGSRELVEQTGQLTSRVEEALDAWGQSSGHYEVILQRLDQIADQLASGGGSAVAPRSSGGASAKPVANSNASTVSAGAGQGSFWEKMKASMADGASASTSSSSAPIPSVSPSSGGQMSASSAEGASPERSLEHLAPPPDVIDVDTATIETLREAVVARDSYISTLISELRTAQPLPPFPDDIKNCDWAPEELLASVRELEQRLKTEVQRECLELSLERARMGRERARLDQVKAQLEGQIKRLSAPAVSERPAEAVPAADPPVATGKLSWLKRLQPKKSDD